MQSSFVLVQLIAVALIDMRKKSMYSTLFLTSSFFFRLANASLVDSVSGVDFYPLSSEIAIESTQDVNEEKCNGCLNGGDCILNDHGLSTCSCPDRFYGNRCQYEGEPCGSGFCHHSSTCIELSLEEGSFIEHICDCTNAYTEDTYYAGEFCQYESTQFCSESNDPHGRQFCVNGGKCPRESHLPCICPEGFSGPRCAFQTGVDGQDYTQCDRPCQNGGTCQKGFKDTKRKEVMRQFVDADFSHVLSESPDFASYDHCVCPPGHFGMYCEYQMQECGSGDHLCFHGSKCVRDGDTFSCDCCSSKMKTAGLFCEYVASDECEQWVDLRNGHRGFCTNGGHCEIDELGSPICTCPSGYIGEHCEYRVDIHDDPFKSSYQVEQKGVRLFVVLGAILVTFVVVMSALVNFLFHTSWQAEESAVKTTDIGIYSSGDEIQHCNNMILNKRKEGDKKCLGFSAVELL